MKDAVKVIVYDTSGRILVLRRSGTHPTLAFHADFPGGDVNPGETLLEAALRELKEETGIELSADAMQYEHLSYTPYGNARVIYSARIAFDAPEVAISWEHDQYDWMHVQDFMQLAKPTGPDHFLELTKQHLLEAH